MTHIAFLGGGNMANAIISGMLAQGYAASEISVVEHNADTRTALSAQYGINTHASVAQVQEVDIWLLAVKPQNMREALGELAPLLNPQQILVSIAAGLTIQTLVDWSGHSKIVRTMPNTPALVGQGITGIYAPTLSDIEQQTIEQLFTAIGSTVWLPDETSINAITAISGSGPAYVFYMMEHLTAAAVTLGFDEATAQKLVKATFKGAVELAQVSPDSFTTLREKVTSKGGTTAAALNAFDTHQVGQGLQTGAVAAAHRAAELAIELAQ